MSINFVCWHGSKKGPRGKRTSAKRPPYSFGVRDTVSPSSLILVTLPFDYVTGH
jgi:hypothetical protein